MHFGNIIYFGNIILPINRPDLFLEKILYILPLLVWVNFILFLCADDLFVDESDFKLYQYIYSIFKEYNISRNINKKLILNKGRYYLAESPQLFSNNHIYYDLPAHLLRPCLLSTKTCKNTIYLLNMQ